MATPDALAGLPRLAGLRPGFQGLGVSSGAQPERSVEYWEVYRRLELAKFAGQRLVLGAPSAAAQQGAQASAAASVHGMPKKPGFYPAKSGPSASKRESTSTRRFPEPTPWRRKME